MRVRYQVDVSDCGAAASAMLADLLGGDGDVVEHQLRVAAGRDGLSLLQVRDGLRAIGLDARAVRVKSPASLLNLATPFVLLTRDDHFVVVERQRHGNLDVVDPAYGRRSIPLRNLALPSELCFPLPAVIAEPAAAIKRARPNSLVVDRLRQIKRLFPAGWRQVLLLLVASLVVQVGGVATALVLRQMAGVSGSVSGATAAALVCSLLAVEGLAVLVRELGTAKLHSIAEAPVQRRFVSRLVARPFQEHLLTRSGSIAGRYSTIEILFQAVYGTTVLGVGESVVGVVAFVVLGFLNPVAALVVAALSLVAVIGCLPLKGQFARLAATRDRFHDATMSSLVHLVEQQEAIRGLGMEDGAFRRWQKAHAVEVHGFLEHNRAVHKINFAQHMFTRIAQIGAPAAALAAGASVPNALAVLILAPMAITPVLLSARRYARWGEIGAHWRRIETVLVEESGSGHQVSAGTDDMSPGASASSLHLLPVQLSVEPMSFAYPGGARIQIHAAGSWRTGQVIGVAGPSGAGKSTLARIIAGLVRAEEGQIVCTNRLGERIDLRSAVAYVPQASAATGDSVAEFLRSVRPDSNITDDDLWAALSVAGLADEVRATRLGLNTRLTSAGGGLSGGQMQRLLITAAYLTERPVIVLDEALSGVPIDIEQEVVGRLRAASRLVIQITHRRESLQHVDCVVSLDDNGAVTAPANISSLGPQV